MNIQLHADYRAGLIKNFIAFTASRLLPYLSITFVLMFQAHQNFSELSILAYILAIYAVPVSLLSMLLAVAGNLVALNRNDLLKNQQLFKSGLAVAICLALLTFLICLSIHYYWITALAIPGLNTQKLKTVSAIYLFSAPLLVVNTFLFFFNEAYFHASSTAKIKLAATVVSLAMVLGVFNAVDNKQFLYLSGAFFVLLEFLSLALYIPLSIRRGLEFRPQFSRVIFQDVLTLGIPIAFGLGIQKVYFLLFTDRLIRLNGDMVSLLSVSMSIIGLLMVPIAAFSQLHSLFVGKNVQALPTCNRIGSAYLCGLAALLAGVFYLFSDRVYRVFASAELSIPTDLPLAVVCLFLASTVMNFSMGQLRAIKDTLVPQSIAGAVLMLGLYPLIASDFFDDASLSTFLYAEAVALLACYLILQCRTRRLG